MVVGPDQAAREAGFTPYLPDWTMISQPVPSFGIGVVGAGSGRFKVRVADLRAALHQAGVFQHREVSRDGRRGHRETRGEVAGGQLHLGEVRQDFTPRPRRQCIEYAIEHHLKRFEAGAQGEHKLARGFEPTPTWSAFWIADAGMRAAVARFLAREDEAMQDYQAETAAHLPYKTVV